MTLMSVAERRTPCSDGPPPRMVSAVVLQGVASLRDATKMAGRSRLNRHLQGVASLRDAKRVRSAAEYRRTPEWTIDETAGNCV